MDNLIGKTIGQYKVVELAGKGGMSTVYKAHQPSLNRYVALKILPEYMAHDQEFVHRFKQEAEAAAALRHPNILVIYDIGEAGNLHYIAAEYLEGQTLEQVVTQGGALPLPRVVKIVNQLASALEAAHQRGMIHRDVKPSNIFIGPNDHVTLADFGIVKALSAARLTRTGTLVGTPEYMSPEQAEGQPLDQRTDLYSLGVVVYQMLTGQTPFTAPTPNAVLYAHVNKSPQPPSLLNRAVPQAIEASVLRALAKKPDERFQTVAEFAAALEKAARQAEGELSAGLYGDARQLLAQGKAAQAQSKLDQLRQLNPGYPGLAELTAEIGRQAQAEREYIEIAKLVRQARERAVEFSRRLPNHPDPEHVLGLPAARPVSQDGSRVWSVLRLVGLTLVFGGLMGYWVVRGIELAGLYVFLQGGLWAGLLLAGGVAALGLNVFAGRLADKTVSRMVVLGSVALVVLSFGMLFGLAAVMDIQLELAGPMLVMVGYGVLGVGLLGRLWS